MHLANPDLLLGQRRRRWPNIKSGLCQFLVLAGLQDPENHWRKTTHYIVFGVDQSNLLDYILVIFLQIVPITLYLQGVYSHQDGLTDRDRAGSYHMWR